MNASEVYWKGQARTIRETAEAWKEDHTEAQSVLAFEAFLDHALVTRDSFGKLYQTTWDDLFAGRLTKPIEGGAALRELFGVLAAAYEDLLAVLRGYEQRGYALTHVDDMERAVRDFRAWEADFQARWPRFDPDELNAVLSAPAEFVDPEEIYREFPELRRQGPA